MSFAAAYAGSAAGILIPDEAAEVGRAYHDDRSRFDPPWHRPARQGGEPTPIGAWEADFRTFARHWRNVKAEQASRQWQGQRHGQPVQPEPARKHIRALPPEWSPFQDELLAEFPAQASKIRAWQTFDDVAESMKPRLDHFLKTAFAHAA